jgi:hypothetical protein
MVVDRLCLFIFSGFMFAAGLGLVSSVLYLDYDDQ